MSGLSKSTSAPLSGHLMDAALVALSFFAGRLVIARRPVS